METGVTLFLEEKFQRGWQLIDVNRHLLTNLAFAVAHCALHPRFAAVTVGSCCDSWKLRRVAGEASNMTENALSILIVIFYAQLQQTEIL